MAEATCCDCNERVDDPSLQAWLAIRLSFFMNAVNDSCLSGLANTEVETSGSRQELCDKEITGCRVGMDNIV